MRPLSLLLLAALGLSETANAIGNAAEVEIVDARSGHVLPVYRHNGRYYVAGEPGHEYSIRIANREAERVLAVASVDGVNVVSGETATPGQTGYVLDAYEHYDIPGWRKSLDRVASFYFTSLPDSYAARTGRARNVGVIGVALFQEKPYAPMKIGAVADGAAAPTTYGTPSTPLRKESPEPMTTVNSMNDRAEPAPPAAQAASSAAAASMPAEKAESRLGTGHGRSMDSTVTNTDFERASDAPAEIVAIYYDSRTNLIAQGVIPQPPSPHGYSPNPFPNSFVPDP